MVKVLGTTTNHLLSRIIRKFIKSKMSHALILFYDETLKCEMVMESNRKGFIAVPAEKSLRGSTVVEAIDVTESASELPAALADKLGEKYDTKGMIGNLWVIIAGFFKRKIKNPWNTTNAVFCSEVIVEGLQELGYPGADQLDASVVNPQQLIDFLKG